jgi:hypothetical protein
MQLTSEILPYSDASGYKVKVSIVDDQGGGTEIQIIGTPYSMSVDEWNVLRDHMDRMISLFAGRAAIQKEQPR